MITWKFLFGEGDFFGAKHEHFLAPGRESPHIYRVPLKGLGEGAGQSIHGGGNKQDERRGNIFGKMGDTGGIIQRDNSTGHCFLIKDSIPQHVSK